MSALHSEISANNHGKKGKTWYCAWTCLHAAHPAEACTTSHTKTHTHTHSNNALHRSKAKRPTHTNIFRLQEIFMSTTIVKANFPPRKPWNWSLCYLRGSRSLAHKQKTPETPYVSHSFFSKRTSAESGLWLNEHTVALCAPLHALCFFYFHNHSHMHTNRKAYLYLSHFLPGLFITVSEAILRTQWTQLSVSFFCMESLRYVTNYNPAPGRKLAPSDTTPCTHMDPI